MESFWKINLKLLPAKINYFAYFAGVASLWPFIQVFGRQLGISDFNVGVIFTAAPVVGIIGNPLFGALADKFRIKKKLFILFILLNLISLLAFGFLPYEKPVNTEDNDGLLHACKEGATIAGSGVENGTVVPSQNSSGIATRDFDSGLSYDSSVFWLYVVLVITGWLAMAVVTSIADALCFQSLGENHHLFGSQRIWGSVGWGGASFLAGYLVDVTSEPNQPKNYTPCLYLVGVFMLVAFVASILWKVEEEAKPKSMAKDLWALLLQPRICVFILACIVVGMCTGLQWNFLYWYVEDLAKTTQSADVECEYMKSLKIIQGAIGAVQSVIGEVPFFYLSGWFIKKLGHVHCISLVLGAFGARFLLYSVVTNPWMILPVELLQGLTYGIFYSTMASYAFIVSPPGTGATVQSFVAAAFEGVGVGIGSFLAGACFKVFTGRLAFRLFGIVSVIACFLHIISMCIINSSSKVHEYEQAKRKEAERVDDLQEGLGGQEIKLKD